MEALVKERDHRQHGAGLDDDVEEVALVDVQPALGNQQVAGGGNRQELGDPFDDPEQNDGNPVWHRVVRRQTTGEDKPKCGGRYFFFLPKTEPMPDLEDSPRWRTLNWPRMACQPM